jgi:6-pyruvoyltetrahydropterin/6-carboxytetrahydropterin synthase
MKQVTKTYGHERGLSATFRQWRAKSHCRFLHGYALSFAFLFECADDEVDENGWVINFGGLKPLEQWLKDTFDHHTLVAKDDPKLDILRDLANDDHLIQLVEVDHTGCEAFAELAALQAKYFLAEGMFGDTKAKLVMVECREHASNAAVHIVDGGVSNMVMSIDGSEAAKQIQGAADEAVRRIQEATGVYNVG